MLGGKSALKSSDNFSSWKLSLISEVGRIVWQDGFLSSSFFFSFFLLLLNKKMFLGLLFDWIIKLQFANLFSSLLSLFNVTFFVCLFVCYSQAYVVRSVYI